MSKEEISTIKKQIVTMKRYANIRDRKSFMASAVTAIDTILRHENFENRSRKKQPALLSLLFQLLPAHYRDDCRMVTLNSVYRQSPFGRQVKTSLTAEKYKEHSRSLLKVLKKIWFEDETSQMCSFSTYMKDFESQIVRLVESNPTVAAASVHGCKIFLPLECHSALESLVHKITDVQRAAIGMHRMKESEKRLLSQEPSSAQTPVKESGAAGAPREISRAQNRFKQGIATANSSSKQIARDGHTNGKKRAVLQQREQENLAKRPKSTCNTFSSKSSSRNPYQRAINQSESKMFTGRSNVNEIQKIQSNAPENLTCPVCEKKTEKPFIAECGHMACISCWSQWLKKSSTCPICRKPTKMESLALAIFKSDVK